MFSKSVLCINLIFLLSSFNIVNAESKAEDMSIDDYNSIINAFEQNIIVKSQKDNMANTIAGDMGLLGLGEAVCTKFKFDNKPALKRVSQKFPLGGGRIDTYLVTQSGNCIGEKNSSNGSRTVSAIIKVRSDVGTKTIGAIEPFDLENLNANCLLSSDKLKSKHSLGETEVKPNDIYGSNIKRRDTVKEVEFNNPSSSEGPPPSRDR